MNRHLRLLNRTRLVRPSSLLNYRGCGIYSNFWKSRQTKVKSICRFNSRGFCSEQPRIPSGSERKKFSLSKVIKWLLLGPAVGCTAMVIIATWDKDWKRSLYFWAQVFPIYVHYRMVDVYTRWLGYDAESRTEAFTKLHNKYTNKIYNTAVHLKGFYLKICQMASARTDVIPKQWVEKLRLLEDSCPYEEFERISEIIRQEYKVKDVHEIFEYIKPTPIGSIFVFSMCCHYGKEVVLKIQYPGIEGVFRGDFVMARRFCKLAQPAHLPFLDETEKQFLTEFNYKLEAENLEEIARNLNNHPFWKNKVIVPNPIKHLCTEKCLVMDYLRGEKLVSALTVLFKNFGAVATSRGQTIDEFMEEQRQRKVQPTATELEIYRIQIRIRDFLWNTLAATSNYTFGLVFWLLGNPNQNIIVPYKYTPIPMNIKHVLDVVNEVHGYEVLMDGAFNGDPHPGNILMMPDGKLGLIDYGQVCNLLVKCIVRLLICIHNFDLYVSQF
ncbi:hypothetical protein RFI_27859 [Reticulomyxa filosa]|uniref:ABC1 atypical kinase-like domain-containing protein n=1 Tax=Reticulomyxa filosa TaxID=46433 RepID=X6M7A3_RETFI|nr:hypothetical protein RFI_27859 [Reticulomyxa filosa]|eukprot:ETO09521.1 hypothetical protein RFI_27859 [Reticulomyxa filosa]